MTNILHIKASFRGDNSLSNKLSTEIVSKIQSISEPVKVTSVDLFQNPIPYLNQDHFGAFNLPKEQHTAKHRALLTHSDGDINQLRNADIIVIGVPMYNFTIPAILKSWIDHVSRNNETFTYAGGTPTGLLANKKVYLAIASGSIYSEGFLNNWDFTENYLRISLGFIGLKDITAFRIEGVGIPELREAAISKGIKSVNDFDFN